MTLLLTGAIVAVLCLTVTHYAAFKVGHLVASVNAINEVKALHDEVDTWKRRQQFDATFGPLRKVATEKATESGAE